MRRCIAILLFAAFILPFALSALALGQGEVAGLPACCRRNGAHHCAMNMAERMQLSKSEEGNAKAPSWQAPLQRCPFCPATAASYHLQTFLAPATQANAVAFFSHPAGTVQTESRRRISRDRSRQKRGPPVVSLA